MTNKLKDMSQAFSPPKQKSKAYPRSKGTSPVVQLRIKVEIQQTQIETLQEEVNKLKGTIKEILKLIIEQN